MKSTYNCFRYSKIMYDNFLYYFGVITVGLILLVNIPVLSTLKKISSPTVINTLIGLDCIIGRQSKQVGKTPNGEKLLPSSA